MISSSPGGYGNCCPNDTMYTDVVDKFSVLSSNSCDPACGASQHLLNNWSSYTALAGNNKNVSKDHNYLNWSWSSARQFSFLSSDWQWYLTYRSPRALRMWPIHNRYFANSKTMVQKDVVTPDLQHTCSLHSIGRVIFDPPPIVAMQSPG